MPKQIKDTMPWLELFTAILANLLQLSFEGVSDAVLLIKPGGGFISTMDIRHFINQNS